MRIMVQSMGRPSAWSRQKEVVADEPTITEKVRALDEAASASGEGDEGLDEKPAEQKFLRAKDEGRKGGARGVENVNEPEEVSDTSLEVVDIPGEEDDATLKKVCKLTCV